MLVCSTDLGLYIFVGKDIRAIYLNRKEFESMASLIRPKSYDEIIEFFNTKIKGPF